MMYFFGCDKEAGHYLHRADMKTVWPLATASPWGSAIDGGLCSKDAAWSLHHLDGWTAIAKTDYSVDTRPGSNCAFLVEEGNLTMDEVKHLARENFPTIAKRVGL